MTNECKWSLYYLFEEMDTAFVFLDLEKYGKNLILGVVGWSEWEAYEGIEYCRNIQKINWIVFEPVWRIGSVSIPVYVHLKLYNKLSWR